MKNFKVVFWGTPDFVIPVLKTVQENFDLVAVVTSHDKPVGRKQILTPSPVNLASQGHTLRGYKPKVLTPEKLTPDVAQQLQKLQPDLFVVAAYGKIIPQFILDIPKYGALNIHPSCLPKYRGPSPIQTAILNGDKTSCITIIKMDEKMDHGSVIFTKEIIVSNQDNFETLSKKMFNASAKILSQIIPDFVLGNIILRGQNHAIASYCSLIKKESGYFDISNPPSPEILDRMIRAYYPWPAVWTRWSPSSHPKRSVKDLRIIKFYPGNMVQIEGKKPTKFEDFLRGYPNFPIKNL